jgi:hypothetical protein
MGGGARGEVGVGRPNLRAGKERLYFEEGRKGRDFAGEEGARGGRLYYQLS